MIHSPARPGGHDLIDELAGLPHEGRVQALRHQRDDTRQALQDCFEALLDSHDPVPQLSPLDRALAALRVASVLQDDMLASTYQQQALAHGATVGMLGRVSPSGDADTLAALNARLTGLLGFVDRLLLQPAVASAKHLEQLSRQRLDAPTIVSLAQTVGLVACQARLLAGLRALQAAGPAEATDAAAPLPAPAPGLVPGRHPHTQTVPVHGRFTLDGLNWRPWLAPVVPAAASAAQQALLDQTAPLARRSAYELTLLHNPALRRPHARLVNGIAHAPLGLPRADRALAAVVVSRMDGCTFGASTLGRVFARLTREPEVIGTLFAQGVNAPLAPRRRALVDLAVDLGAASPSVAAGRIQALRAAGLAELEILDAIHVIAVTAWDDRLAQGLGEAVGPGQA